MPDQKTVIEDPEELSQKKRIREILNRRTGVIDKRVEAKDAWVAGELTQLQALQLYQNAIEGMVMELWTKFLNADDADGEKLLYSEEIAEVTVYPPADKMPETEHDFAAGADMPEPKTVSIEGLDWYLNNQPVVERSFTITTWNPPGKQRITGQSLVGFPVMDKAVKKCIEFIDKTGIDADMEEEEQQTKIDRELLEEVEEWRQQNVD